MTQRLPVSWTGFTKFSFLNQNFLREKCRLGGDLRRSKQLPDQILVAWDLDWLGAKWKTKVRQREGWEKLTSLIRRIENTRKPQNGRKKLKVPMEAAMPCQMGTRKRQKGAAGNWGKRDHRIQWEEKVCMCRGSAWIHEKAFGIHSS